MRISWIPQRVLASTAKTRNPSVSWYLVKQDSGFSVSGLLKHLNWHSIDKWIESLSLPNTLIFEGEPTVYLAKSVLIRAMNILEGKQSGLLYNWWEAADSKHRLQQQGAQVQIPTLRPTSCVDLGKTLYLSELLFLHCKMPMVTLTS